MIEINLVPDVKQELIRAQRVRSAVISVAVLIGAVSVGVVIILAGYVFGGQALRGSIVDKAISDGSAKLAKVEDLSKMLTIQNQLTKINALNNDKKITSRLFDAIYAITPPEPNTIQISSLGVDTETRIISIEGQAENSYIAVETFEKTIGGANLKYKDGQGASQQVGLATNIITSDTSYGEDSSGKKVLRFSLSFVYAAELFSPSSKEISFDIANKGNVTDSYLGVPKSIFVDRATDITGGQ